MIWLDRVKYGETWEDCKNCKGTGFIRILTPVVCPTCEGAGRKKLDGPGDVFIFCAACQEKIILTLPLAFYVVQKHAEDFAKAHEHGRQPGEPPLQTLTKLRSDE